MTKRIVLFLGALLLCVVPGIASVNPKEPGVKPDRAVAGEKKARAAKAETISGSVVMVVNEKKLLILAGIDGVPYNFKVTAATQIKIGERKGNLGDLAGLINRRASVTFLPLHEGNIAQTIEVQQ